MRCGGRGLQSCHLTLQFLNEEVKSFILLLYLHLPRSFADSFEIDIEPTIEVLACTPRARPERIMLGIAAQLAIPSAGLYTKSREQ